MHEFLLLSGHAMHTTPITLLERVQTQSDELAWKQFVQLYSPLLFFWAKRCGASPEDAADLVQEVFVVLIQKLPHFRYDPRGKFRDWLRTVTLNKLRDRMRQQGREDRARAHVPALPAVPDVAEVFWQSEYHRELACRALQLIQREFAEATWKAFWETVVRSRPSREVAAELSVTENAVYISRCRVLRRLRRELGGLLE